MQHSKNGAWAVTVWNAHYVIIKIGVRKFKFMKDGNILYGKTPLGKASSDGELLKLINDHYTKLDNKQDATKAEKALEKSDIIPYVMNQIKKSLQTKGDVKGISVEHNEFHDSISFGLPCGNVSLFFTKNKKFAVQLRELTIDAESPLDFGPKFDPDTTFVKKTDKIINLISSFEKALEKLV